MSYNPNAPRAEAGDYYANLCNPGTLRVVKPNTKHRTIVRLLPELDETGRPVPMVKGYGPNGPLFSMLTMEPVVTLAGVDNKFTGFTRCSDVPNADDFTVPWSGLYIHLKSQINKRTMNPMDEVMVRRLIDGDKAPLKKPSNCVFAQCAVLELNGKPATAADLATPTAIMLTPSAVKSFNAVLMKAAQDGIDLFDYDKGYTLVITGVPSGDGKPDLFSVTPGQQLVVPPEARGRFVPWDKAIKLMTMDEHIRQMVLCFGANVVGMRPGLLDAMSRLGIAPAARAQVSNPAGYQQPPQQYQQQQPQAQTAWGQAPQAPPAQTAAPAPAQAWGTPPQAQSAPPQAPAQTQPAWGAAPAATPAPAPTAWGQAPQVQQPAAAQGAWGTPPAAPAQAQPAWGSQPQPGPATTMPGNPAAALANPGTPVGPTNVADIAAAYDKLVNPPKA